MSSRAGMDGQLGQWRLLERSQDIVELCIAVEPQPNLGGYGGAGGNTVSHRHTNGSDQIRGS